MNTPALSPEMSSARPDMTIVIRAVTGLDDATLGALVHGFYTKVRADPVLGPIFAARITDWGSHVERMLSFWSSVALMTGRYHGRPVPAHTSLPINAAHFDRWLQRFRQAAQEVCTPEGVAHAILRAERIARSLQIAVAEAQAAPDAVPSLLFDERIPRWPTRLPSMMQQN
ncbi:MAG: group III truncated hemoglobin [Pseudotabrizicola sp.]|uniref:group III truncated hemoglobin n=2 Tax=Pseudotabrizicola sp. TaxID=2939647 RepID=UPI0027241187|nr:group III truncated hemoglobin [Pseudotabrizicola sp.]MDO8884279.1 group III truncated hemoglobin [Pseudotabrizicola sp.]MDP2080243.1 group III truncated hemoglobin [Pseudotabrizicola sp.]MDZ7575328.1 group III truncated hemoglobin [Pseudotabrizicola sp.]